MEWTEVVAVVAISCLGSSGIFYLLSEHLLARRLKAYEAELSLAHDKEIASLKADMRVAAYEREAQYHLLQTKRAEVIAKLYELLVNAEDRALASVEKAEAGQEEPTGTGWDPVETQADIDACSDLMDFYKTRRIYFSRSLCEQLSRIAGMIAIFAALAHYRRYPGGGAEPPEDLKRLEAQWHEVRPLFTAFVGETRPAVEAEFRSLLGVNVAEEPHTETEQKNAADPDTSA